MITNDGRDDNVDGVVVDELNCCLIQVRSALVEVLPVDDELDAKDKAASIVADDDTLGKICDKSC